MSDTHGVARDQLRAFIERIERLEEEKKTIADDIKDVYGEAKSMGFDTKILKKVVALRKKDDQERMEEEIVLGTYLSALGMIQADFFEGTPAETNTSVGSGRGSAAPLRARSEAISETPKQVYGDSVEDATAPPSQSVEIPAGGDQGQKIDGSDDRCPAEFHSPEQAIPSDDDAIAAVKGRARLANVADVEPPSSAPIAPASHGEAGASSGERVTPHSSGSAAANTGGDHVVREPSAATHQAGALVEPAPATPGYLTYEDFPPVPMKRTSFARGFPELSQAEYGRLQFSIAGKGINEPIVRKGDIILDGWSRYNIARNLGIQYPVIEYDGEDELLDVIRWQRAARKFTPAQSKKIAVELAKEVPHRASDIMAAFELEMEEA